ncbi:molecular chaperone DnaJ [Idiomarina seosinensis]|uniref:DNA-J related domain-containing protein n=1 Tax=Idiomarina seosinensis TaxID=281739 RepID=UPI00384C46BA
MEEDIEILCTAIAELLKKEPQWTEHQLIEALKQPPYELFDEQALREPLSLFQTHFLVFHCLYRLRAAWRTQQYADLTIHTLSIKRLPWSNADAMPEPVEPLAAYYLDLNQLQTTSGEAVEELLESFWKKMGTASSAGSPSMSYQHACQLLEIEPPVSSAQLLKHQYRRMIHRHHPDKGGNLVVMQDLKKAYNVLLNS